MSLLSYIFPQTIAHFSTKYNKDIRLNEEYGRYKLLVNGSRQSGAYIEMLWEKAFGSFGILPNVPVHKILVLGVAGGSVIHILHRMFPKASIQGVDIDQKMIDIGASYFGLKKIHNFTVDCQDAENYIVKALRRKEKYDLVVVDLFSGSIIPDFVREKSFLSALKQLLTQRGFIIINYLQEFEYMKFSQDLDSKLQSVFSHNKSFSIKRNRFFFSLL
ncbi:methyltransferase domain-containing protein [Candidatus Gottesmanbacteria bacterium]|nr:methyltransferase domain-containing protein [Candidatus Gottesmanbacteria bacterium]